MAEDTVSVPDSFSNMFIAADNHNIGNVQLSWLDPESWGVKLGNVGKLAATSILSGADSFYNTGAQVANWFGAGITEHNTQNWITSLDSDLGLYYSQNKEAADIAGFVLGSFIPGLGGIKLFNAGQRALKIGTAEGLIGNNLSKATGLLIPKTELYTNAAIDLMNKSTTSYKLINANTLKAFAAGVQQNVLESAAFEVAVQATMFKSPVLEDQDVFDIAKNLVVGGAVGGVIGGAFEAASTVGKLRAARNIEDRFRFPFQSRVPLASKTSPADRIVLLSEDSDAAAVPIVITKSDGTVVENNFAVNKNLYDAKIERNNNDIRSSIHDLTPSDPTLANIVANSTLGVDHRQMFSNFHGANEINRITEVSQAEKAFAKAGQGAQRTFTQRYVKLLGEDLGTTQTESPGFISLGDLYSGQSGVLNAVRKYKFNVEKEWNPLEVLKDSKGGYLQGEARHIWAQDVLTELKPGTVINQYDIPLLQRAYQDKQLNIQILDNAMNFSKPSSMDDLYQRIRRSQYELAIELLKKPQYAGNTDAVSAVTNMRKSYLEGTQSTSEFNDLFAMQADAKNYLDSLKSKNLPAKAAEAVDPKYLPKWAKITYDLNSLNLADGNVANAITLLKEQQKLYNEEARRVASKVLGQVSTDLFPDMPADIIEKANRGGSGPGLVSAENSNYGTTGSHMAYIGSRTRDAKQAMKQATQDAMDSALAKMAAKPEAALEFESINRTISRSGENWIYDPSVNALITKKAVRDFSDDPLAKSYDESQVFSSFRIPDYSAIPSDSIIFVRNAETQDVVKAHIERSGERVNSTREIRAAQGHSDVHDPTVFRTIKPDLQNLPHFAFVVDDKVTGSGHVSMLHAATETDLGQLIDRVPKHRYRVVTKREQEEFDKARGEYEYSRGLHENYITKSLNKEAIFSDFFPKADPTKIVNDILQQHLKEDTTLVTEAVRLMYEPQFNALEDLGKSYSKISTSKFGQSTASLERVSDNPYLNYIKTALDISKAPEYELLYSANKTLDSAFSRAWATVKSTFDSAKTPADLEAVNSALDKYGMKPAMVGSYDAGMYDLLNHTAPKGDLTRFVRAANATLSRFVLGLDPLNALNNAIGANLLRTTELQSIIRAIDSGNTDIAGELAKVGKVAVPGTPNEILSAPKIISKAIANYFGANKALYIAKYKEAGFIKNLTEQFHQIVDDFTLKGTETVGNLNGRISSGFEKAKELTRLGETATGNTLAEEFNRFISANVMDQVTSIAVRNGLLSEKEALSYINTFVNRVEGNVIATQRPLIFQGPIGQAIGLFQSYQFNLLQQLFRYVGEGSKKDLAMLAGMQSTLYGLQSLPAFQFLNTHIVGTLGGNKEHRDLYDTAYGIAGRQAGDFFLYGLPSNLLQGNIYSRGDINPRSITVIPSNVQEIPIVAGWAKFFGSLYQTIEKSVNGGNVWESFLQGLEHNGISRPLQGLAQVLQATGPDGKVFSTSSKGSILGSNDLMHWASMIRLAGGRPLDEALTNDTLFRVKSYEAARRNQMLDLAEAVKTSLIGGREADPESVNKFAQEYANLGGKQPQFNHWMMNLYKNANVSQADQLAAKLHDPFAYKMQLLMGGTDQ